MNHPAISFIKMCFVSFLGIGGRFTASNFTGTRQFNSDSPAEHSQVLQSLQLVSPRTAAAARATERTSAALPRGKTTVL